LVFFGGFYGGSEVEATGGVFHASFLGCWDDGQ
jgi:hypothetical protein